MKKLILIGLGCVFTAVAGWAQSADAPSFTRTEDVIYGRKFGTTLTLDVFQPKQPNGYGIALMVSGGLVFIARSHKCSGLPAAAKSRLHRVHRGPRLEPKV